MRLYSAACTPTSRSWTHADSNYETGSSGMLRADRTVSSGVISKPGFWLVCCSPVFPILWFCVMLFVQRGSSLWSWFFIRSADWWPPHQLWNTAQTWLVKYPSHELLCLITRNSWGLGIPMRRMVKVYFVDRNWRIPFFLLYLSMCLSKLCW